MVIDQIHIAGMNAVEAEDDAPVARDADRLESRQIAFQGMQSVSGQVHVGGLGGLVQTGKDAFHLVGLLGRHPAPIPLLVEELQPLVPKSNDYEIECNP